MENQAAGDGAVERERKLLEVRGERHAACLAAIGVQERASPSRWTYGAR